MNTPLRARDQARVHAARIERAARLVYGREYPFDAGITCAKLATFLSANPMRAATKRHAAIHEAGHLITFEAEGIFAFDARIEGSPFGWGGWSGGARHAGELYLEPGPWAHDPEDFLRSARGALAGPIAEELVGGGDALSSIGELVEARVLVDRAAELSGRDECVVWRETLLRTGALVERYRRAIFEIAELLERRKRVSRCQPSVRKILSRAQQTPIDTTDVSARGMALVRRIETALMELAR